MVTRTRLNATLFEQCLCLKFVSVFYKKNPYYFEKLPQGIFYNYPDDGLNLFQIKRVT